MFFLCSHRSHAKNSTHKNEISILDHFFLLAASVFSVFLWVKTQQDAWPVRLHSVLVWDIPWRGKSDQDTTACQTCPTNCRLLMGEQGGKLCVHILETIKGRCLKFISIFVVWKHILILNLSRWHLRCVLDHLTTTDNVSYSVYNLPHPSSPFFPLLWNIFVLIFNSSLYFYSCLCTYSYLYFYIIPFYSRYYQIGVAVHLANVRLWCTIYILNVFLCRNVLVCQHCENVLKFLRAARYPPPPSLWGCRGG